MTKRRKRDYREEAREQVYGLLWASPPWPLYERQPINEREALAWLCRRVNEIAEHLGHIYAALDINYTLQEDRGLIHRRIEELTVEIERRDKEELAEARRKRQLQAEARRSKRADQGTA